jgi:hypothetical protein
MAKTRTTINISKDLLRKTREKEINISSFVDIELKRIITLIEGKTYSISKPKETITDSIQLQAHFPTAKANNSNGNTPEDSGLWGSLVSLWLREQEKNSKNT